MNARILVVDDERSMCELLADAMGQCGFDVTWRLDGAAALDFLRQHEVDAVITDLNMRGISGLELCGVIHDELPELPVIVLTAFGSLESAIEAIRVGAYDFVHKPVEMKALRLVLDRAVEHRQLRSEVVRLRHQTRASSPPSGILGESMPMKQLEALLPKAARAGVPILVVGETGTGKELVARALHDLSPRADGPFIALNCAAVPSNLLESELFGHVRGAFTDAKRAREGLFVQANGGTLLLDEIGELPLPLQPKLLRALQERRLRPVGGSTEVAFDCSIVTATNRDLRTEIRTGGFREDLFYRVNVIQLDVPPLRVRGADILLLAQHFLGAARLRRGGGPAGITTAAARALLAHSWPGNVRELENCMQRAVAMAEHNQLLLSDLPEQVRSSRPLGEGAADCGLCPLEEVERRHIERVLEAMGGNRSAAAKILRIDRKTLYRKLDRWERG